jgi:hypothetical protein
MLESILSMLKPVNNALKMTGHYDLCITEDAQETLEELMKYLLCFKDLTELVSSNQPYLGLIPLIKKEITDASQIRAEDCQPIKELKKKILENIDRRLKVSNEVMMACLVDPALKDTVDLESEEKLRCLSEEIESIQPGDSRLATDFADDQGSKRQRLLHKMKGAMECSSHQSHMSEIQGYLNTQPTQEEEDNPLVFWQHSHTRFPHIAAVARKYLSLSASSVPVECMFSSVGLLTNGKRSSLSPSNLNYICFIHDNFRLFNEI